MSFHKQEKGFIISNEAWYCQLPETHLDNDEMLIGKFYDGACGVDAGEVVISWEDNIPHVKKYSDTKEAMRQIPEAVPLIKDICDREITPRELAEALLDIGYVDLTERVKQF